MGAMVKTSVLRTFIATALALAVGPVALAGPAMATEQSAPAGPDVSLVAAPTNVRVVSVGPDFLVLAWDPTTTGYVDFYRLFISTDGRNWQLIQIIPGEYTTTTVEQLSPHVVFQFYLVAVKGGFASNPSNLAGSQVGIAIGQPGVSPIIVPAGSAPVTFVPVIGPVPPAPPDIGVGFGPSYGLGFGYNFNWPFFDQYHGSHRNYPPVIIYGGSTAAQVQANLATATQLAGGAAGSASQETLGGATVASQAAASTQRVATTSTSSSAVQALRPQPSDSPTSSQPASTSASVSASNDPGASYADAHAALIPALSGQHRPRPR